MRPILRAFPVATALVLSLWAGRALATDNIYLAIPEVPGEACKSGVCGPGVTSNTIQLTSLTENFTTTPRTFTATYSLDRSTHKLLAASVANTVFKSATIAVYRAGAKQPNYLTYRFENLRVLTAHFELPASSGTPPVTTITFTADRVTWSYSVQRADGTLEPAIVTMMELRTAIQPVVPTRILP